MSAPWQQGLKDRHFLIACATLLVTFAGWSAAKAYLGIVTQKEPVPWPAGVRVSDDFRLLTLPTRLGPFARVETPGEIFRDANGSPRDPNWPDGEIQFDETLRENLGIGTGDRALFAKRCSNWYVSRIYRDTRKPPGHGYWSLDVYYYTGGKERVPHIPDVCLQAGGSELLGTDVMKFPADPNLASPWNGPVEYCRTSYQRPRDNRRFAVYYTFSLNGQPEADREIVRLKLSSLFQRYGYFGKIQFGPFFAYGTEQTEDDAQEFMKYALPAVLETLPSQEDMKKL